MKIPIQKKCWRYPMRKIQRRNTTLNWKRLIYRPGKIDQLPKRRILKPKKLGGNSSPDA